MERVSFEIERQDVADALHAEAEARGRSVEAELAALVERTYAANPPTKPFRDGNWVAGLVALAKEIDLPGGIQPMIPQRLCEDFEPPSL